MFYKLRTTGTAVANLAAGLGLNRTIIGLKVDGEIEETIATPSEQRDPKRVSS